MTVKKVEAERLGRWLKDPVTRAYLEAVKELNNENASLVAGGACIGKDGSVSELYYHYMGILHGLQRCYDAGALMQSMGFVKGDSDEE